MKNNAVLVKKAEHIATITMNRPEVMNALNDEMFQGLVAALDDVNRDDDVRVVILTGAGKAFCSAVDIEEKSRGSDALMADTTIPEGIRFARRYPQAITRSLIRLEKPTIASVNGAAVADGFDWALACDMRVASTKARFLTGFIRMGLAAITGATWLYPKVLGLTKALELLYTSDWLSAEEANKLGILNKLVAPEDLEKETMALARKLAKQAPIPMRMMKSQVYRGLETNLDVILDLAADAEMICCKTEDHKEALAAYRQKREPVFKGK